MRFLSLTHSVMHIAYYRCFEMTRRQAEGSSAIRTLGMLLTPLLCYNHTMSRTKPSGEGGSSNES